MIRNKDICCIIPQQTFDVSTTSGWRLTLTLDWRCRKVENESFLDVGFWLDWSRPKINLIPTSLQRRIGRDQKSTWFQRLYNVGLVATKNQPDSNVFTTSDWSRPKINLIPTSLQRRIGRDQNQPDSNVFTTSCACWAKTRMRKDKSNLDIEMYCMFVFHINVQDIFASILGTRIGTAPDRDLFFTTVCHRLAFPCSPAYPLSVLIQLQNQNPAKHLDADFINVNIVLPFWI